MANVKGSYGRFGYLSNEEGRLLLAQRRWRRNLTTKEREPDDRWNLLGGGVDEEDAEVSRSSAAIIAREILEEAGLKIVIADHRPVGEYPTAKHTDVAITYLCSIVGGQLTETEESKAFKYVTPSEAMEMARRGDIPEGLVGGLVTSTGGVPRHIQMVLHYFTRACHNEQFRQEAEEYCQELRIPT